MSNAAQAGSLLLAPAATSLAHPLVLPVAYAGAGVGSQQQHVIKEYQVIPSYSVSASAGSPNAARAARVHDATANLAGDMAFDRAWLRSNLGRDGGGFVSVSVTGNSMEPSLIEGDTVIIDTLVDRVDANGIYVIRHGVDLLVKRIQRKLDGTLVIKGDNAAYEPEVLGAEPARALKVIGRLVWPRVR